MTPRRCGRTIIEPPPALFEKEPMSADPTRRRPTVVDVAREAGVSFKTVSRVINGVPTVDPALRDRVVAAIAETGYQRNDMAHTLRSGKLSSSVGLVIEDLANPFYSAIAATAADRALQRGVLLFIASSEEDPEREQNLIAAMCERRVAGLLIVPTSADHSYLRAQTELGVPVVFIDREAAGVRADSVLIDNPGGARQAIEYLLQRRHRRIAILSDTDQITTMRQRRDAALEMLAEAGQPVDPSLVRMDIHDPQRALEEMEQLLTRPRPPTAFFCLNNRITVGALQALMASGTSADVAGFDDFEASTFISQPVGLVSYDTGSLGRHGADLLFRRIDGDSSRPRRLVIPTKLIERGPPTRPDSRR